MWGKPEPVDLEDLARVTEETAAGIIEAALASIAYIPSTLADPDPANRRVRLRAARTMVNRVLKPDLRSRLTPDQFAALKQARADLAGKR